MKNQRTSQTAFTLIELLIVVAIIAILAAIAVPNFLEAQTRSKVTRVKSDQRTIATALEAYRLDQNVYPEQGVTTSATWPFETDPTKVYGADGPRSAANNPAIAFRLSTPIAYLSSTKSVFKDPFFSGFSVGGTSVVNDTRYYNYSGDYVNGRVYDAGQDGADTAAFLTLSQKLAEINHWHLRSRGPDGDYEARKAGGWAGGDPSATPPVPADGGSHALYDASNGTLSSGDIVRLGSDGAAN